MWNAPGPIGSLGRSMQDPIVASKRQRDIYPLPLATSALLLESGSDMKEVPEGALQYVNCCLELYYGIRAPVRLPRAPNAPQSDVIRRVISSSKSFMEHLTTCLPTHVCYSNAWNEYEQTQAPRSVQLKASLIDNVEVAGSCDPLNLLPTDIVDQITCSSALFPEPPKGLERFPGFFSGERKEYIKLVVSQLRCGKISLASGVRGGGTVIAVNKSGEARQREVWHGARVSKAALSPPRPRHLASPSAFKGIDMSTAGQLRVSKRDGRCFFDQLLLPSSLRPFMGRPKVSVAELLEAGMTMEEVSAVA